MRLRGVRRGTGMKSERKANDMRTLYIECSMGAAGDMLMAAFYELLEDKQAFLNVMNSLGLPDVRLEAAEASTCGIAGTHMTVKIRGEEEHEYFRRYRRSLREAGNREAGGYGHDHEHSHDHGHSHSHPHTHTHDYVHTSPVRIAELIDGMKLPGEVKRHARAVYDAIAQAEAKAHGCSVEEVHYHEVGALDAVADVTGVSYALHLLHPDRIVVSPIHVGSGTVRCSHGVMPVPAPATANLLAGVPVYGGEIRGELCTPTGAALLTHFADSFGSMPVMTLRSTGIGIGNKTFENRANCVRVFLGEEPENAAGGKMAESEIVELVCNIDDMTPEALSFASRRLLELGALDVYTVAGTMKKGRSGHVLTVLCRADREEETAEHILEQTTTNGLRVRRCGKYALVPGTEEKMTEWGKIRIKTADGFGVKHRKPEYDDVSRAAEMYGISYQRVLEDILRRENETYTEAGDRTEDKTRPAAGDRILRFGNGRSGSGGTD